MRRPTSSVGLSIPGVAPVSAAAELYGPGDVVAGRYEVKRLAGAGRASAVYRVFDREVDLDVALKVISPNLIRTPDEHQAVQKELFRVRKLSHPNIARVYDVTRDGPDGPHVISMQILEGPTLRRVIRGRIEKNEVFTLRDAEPILSQVVAALNAAKGVTAHGLLKPENVIILPDLLKVTDFRFVCAIPREPYVALQRADGGVNYLAPELHATGTEPEPEADVFSLGVILAEMMTGFVPAHGDTEIADPRGLDAGSARQLKGLLTKSINRNPRARFKEVQQLLDEFLDLVQIAESGAGSTGVFERMDEVPMVDDVDLLDVADTGPPVAERPTPRASGAFAVPEAEMRALEALPHTAEHERSPPAKEVGESEIGADDIVESRESTRDNLRAPAELKVVSGEAGDDGEMANVLSPIMTAPEIKPDKLPDLRLPSDDAELDALHHRLTSQPAIRAGGSAPGLERTKVAGAANASGGAASAASPRTQQLAVRHTNATRSAPTVAGVPAPVHPTPVVPITRAPVDKRPASLTIPLAMAVVAALAAGGIFYLYTEYSRKQAENEALQAALDAERKKQMDLKAALAVAHTAPTEPKAQDPMPAVADPPKAKTVAKPTPPPASATAGGKTSSAESEPPESAFLADAEPAKPVAPPGATQPVQQPSPSGTNTPSAPPPAAPVGTAGGAPPTSPAPGSTTAPAPSGPGGPPQPALPAVPGGALAAAPPSTPSPPPAPAAPPPPACPKGMVFVPGGSFTIGSSPKDPERGFGEIEAKTSQTAAYCIDLYEYPNAKGLKPKINASQAAAQAMCKAAKKRLCTEEEWERACKGPGQARYPYGNVHASGTCNTLEGEPAAEAAPIGSFPACASGYGPRDMGGNVEEWTDTKAGGGYVTKGGNYERPGAASRCAARAGRPGSTKAGWLGFRCCANPM